jgi:hypothetical protein
MRMNDVGLLCAFYRGRGTRAIGSIEYLPESIPLFSWAMSPFGSILIHGATKQAGAAFFPIPAGNA